MLGDKIREARKERGYTQAQLGKMVGLTGQVISNLERGYTEKIPLENADKLAMLLGMSTYELYTNNEGYKRSKVDFITAMFKDNPSVMASLNRVMIEDGHILKDGKHINEMDENFIKRQVKLLIEAIEGAETRKED